MNTYTFSNKNQFVPYELAVKLKELGFDEGCFGTYSGEVLEIGSDIPNDDYFTRAPLWQQAFDWFREKYKINSWILPNGPGYTFLEDSRSGRPIPHSFHNTYEEARQACLEKLIELCQQN